MKKLWLIIFWVVILIGVMPMISMIETETKTKTKTESLQQNTQKAMNTHSQRFFSNRTYIWCYNPLQDLKIEITSTPAVVYSGEKSTVTVHVTYQGSPAQGVTVTITSVTNGGSCSPTSGTTDTNGDFKTTFTAPTVTTNTICTVNVKASKQGVPDATGSKDIPVASYPTITVNYPNGGEYLFIGNKYNVRWYSAGGIVPKEVKIEFSTQGSSGPWNEINNGSYSKSDDGNEDWTIPNVSSTNCYMKISATDGGGKHCSDTSDSSFTIRVAPPPLRTAVKVPNSGEIWLVNSTQDIKWESDGGIPPLSVKLEYSTSGSSGTFKFIKDNLPASGSYSWKVPNEPSTKCYIRVTVTDKLGTTTTDLSDTPFKIVTKMGVDVRAPDGDEVWMCGGSYDVKWCTVGGTNPINITIRYSTTGYSGPWYEINNGSYSHENDGVEKWTIPYVDSTHCCIKITAVDSSSPPITAEDMSVKYFTITPAKISVSVKKPAGGEVWIVNETREIAWNASGGAGGSDKLKITIKYSSTGQNGPYKLIVANYSNTGSYQWKIPYENSTSCYVKINASDTIGTYATDTNDVPFSIRPLSEKLSVSIEYPAGSENFVAGSKQTIKWTTRGGIQPYTYTKIEYKTSVSGSYKLIVENPTTPNNYVWIVPKEQSTDCYIRVTVRDSATPPHENDAVSKNFSISIPPDTEKPVIKHTPVTSGVEGLSIKIECVITDNEKVAYGKLYYRKKGSVSYTATFMSVQDNNYRTEIPGSQVTKQGLQYYIEAKDIVGNTATQPDDISNPYTIVVYPALGSLKGRAIRSADKQPLADANVDLLYLSNGTKVKTTTTDPQGTFMFRGLLFTVYNLTISKSGFMPKSLKVELKKENPDMDMGAIEISKILGSITGIVVDNVNHPIFEARVNATAPNGTVYPTTTDYQGVFYFKNMEIGRYEISISKPGYISIQKTCEITAQKLNVNMGTIQLKAKPAQGGVEGGSKLPLMELIFGLVAIIVCVVVLVCIMTIFRKKREAELSSSFRRVWVQAPPRPQPQKQTPTPQPTEIAPTPPSPQPIEEPKIDLAQELKRLTELRDAGVISQEEFEFSKRGLLKKALRSEER